MTIESGPGIRKVKMEAFLRDNVDLQAISGKALAGDAHFFEDVTTPAKIRSYLDSFKVRKLLYLMKLILIVILFAFDWTIGGRKAERDEAFISHAFQRS